MRSRPAAGRAAGKKLIILDVILIESYRSDLLTTSANNVSLLSLVGSVINNRIVCICYVLEDADVEFGFNVFTLDISTFSPLDADSEPSSLCAMLAATKMTRNTMQAMP